MNERPSVPPRRTRPSPAPWLAAALALILVAGGCVTESPAPSATGTPAVSLPASPPPTATPAPTPTPTPAPPPLSLEIPDATDARQVQVTVVPEVAPDGGGQITVTVTSLADEMVRDLVLRWPQELANTHFLAPFIPDPALIREDGGNLVRPWTKWVNGPGEHGEPAGTTSLGYGPLQPRATLTIPLYVTRVAPGPVSFDLQILSGEEILTLADGQPAELRVDVP